MWSRKKLERRKSSSPTNKRKAIGENIINVSQPTLVEATTWQHKQDGNLVATPKDFSDTVAIRRTSSSIDPPTIKRFYSMDDLDDCTSDDTKDLATGSDRRRRHMSSFDPQSDDWKVLNRRVGSAYSHQQRRTRISVARKRLPEEAKKEPQGRMIRAHSNPLLLSVSSDRSVKKSTSSQQLDIVDHLHNPKTIESLQDALKNQEVADRVNEFSYLGDTALHSILRNKRRERTELLLALLTHSKADVNCKSRRDGNPPLHIAIQEKDEMCIKALIAFGADLHQTNDNRKTALDIAQEDSIVELLHKLGGKKGTEIKRRFTVKIPHMKSHAQKMIPSKFRKRLNTNEAVNRYVQEKRMQNFCRNLERTLSRRLSESAFDEDDDTNETLAIALQQKEIYRFKKTQDEVKLKYEIGGAEFKAKEGSRLLFLDGGGIKGLAEIEILCQIEEETGRKITELFDWIVGTSSGAIIALGMVYANKTLPELRQLYYRMKDQVFAKARAGFAYNSKALEVILQEVLGTEMMMKDVSQPKVLIAAVNKKTTNPTLHFFNNCFGDEFSEYPVWKVARYTSAAPMFFSECDNYVDGGVLANNPCDYGMTAIQSFYREQGVKLPIAMVVSVGGGVYPAEKLGKVDAQKFLFFGKHWFNPEKLMKRTQNLISLLSNALVESEMVAKNCKSRCNEQDIPFYRFSPQLDDVIAAGETDNEKLLNMIMQTKIQAKEQGLDEMIEMFRIISGIGSVVPKQYDVLDFAQCFSE